MKTTILVIEDEPAILELITVNLEFAGYLVRQAHNAEQAIASIQDQLPDLALIDWMLPGMSGVALTSKLRRDERTRTVPIILLTAKGTEHDKVEGLDSGADDYITKPFSPKELMARIQALLRRRAPELADATIKIGTLALNPATHEVSGDGVPLSLGPAEFRLLRFFMAHAERVYSREQLLDQVWGDHVFVEERTVDVHIRRLRKALEPTGHQVHIQTVRGTGYRFVSRPV